MELIKFEELKPAQQGYLKLVFLGVYKGSNNEEKHKRWREIIEQNLFSQDKIEKISCADIEKLTEKQFVMKMLGIDEDKFKKEIKISEIQNLRRVINRILSKDKNIPKDSNFNDYETICKWYLEQEQKCYYCKISQVDLKKLFEDKKISSKKRSFSATLQIEKKNPDKGYTTENCVLACCLCNNAKSDMINERNYTDYFAKQMKEFLDKLYEDKITNEMDKTTD